MIVFCSYAQVAQSVEQRTENPRVDGSIPPLGTNYKKLSNTSKAQVAQSVEQRTENPRVDGSIPPLGTMNSKGSDLIGAFFMSEGFWWEGLLLSSVTSVVLKMWILDMHLSLWLN